MVLSNKKIDDILNKKVKKEFDDKNKDIFQEAKNLIDLMVEIYKNFVVEKKNLKFEKTIEETVKFKNQEEDLSETPEKKDFINNIENKSKTIDNNLFKDYFKFELLTALTKQ